ncbi:MAG: hypothetical protein IJ777_01680 [Clostridia bacterium]|nr:hypothetical protein [Clostridia bacterium]
MKDYSKIINLPHHVSKKHPQMSLEARSAQFAPFAALTGYQEEVEETGRLTSKRIEIDEEQKTILDGKLQMILNQMNMKPTINITYFVPDQKKEGGEYVTITGSIKKIDEYGHIVVMEDNLAIPIEEMIDISGELFKTNEETE